MDVVGSEIGQKMRSAIKAKLTELGCYVDDELPDYVMVMVANKRTRLQMEEDLQLFLGDNTMLFVNWLHQVLKKLQEVSVAPPIKPGEIVEKPKDLSSSKDNIINKKKSKSKNKDKDKEKHKKKDGSKKTKKKDKDKTKKLKKKNEKKAHKIKKKSKDHEMIRPNVPPLLMNMEKVSEPSITDVFAGQILKNHGITLETAKEEPKIDKKPDIQELKRPIIPIIDPATISSHTEDSSQNSQGEDVSSQNTNDACTSGGEKREEQIKEITQIEAKIQGLKQKLAEQLDSMSDDEDFLNIRTEAEELMNDFAEDVLQEVQATKPPSVDTPPLQLDKSCPSTPTVATPINIPNIPIEIPSEPETLPQIELNLPKRPIRERLGARLKDLEKDTKASELKKTKDASEKRPESPERFTPEREPDFWPQKSAKSRLGEVKEANKRVVPKETTPEPEPSSKRVSSRVSVLESREARSGPASVVRVRPRPRPTTGAPASNLLMRAMADAHKSLLNIPPKIEPESSKIKRALVLPMRRAKNLVIQVDREPSPVREQDSEIEIDLETESLADLASDQDTQSDKPINEYVPALITKKIINSNYLPSRRSESVTSKEDDISNVETINIHNTTVGKDIGPTFVVTLDGLDPNIFLAKKLKTEGILDEAADLSKEIQKAPSKPKPIENTPTETDSVADKESSEKPKTSGVVEKKRLSNTSEDSDTQVIIQAPKTTKNAEAKRKSSNVSTEKHIELSLEKHKNIDLSSEKRKSNDLKVLESPPVKKRKASPIVFKVEKKERVRERTDSVSSDNLVVVKTSSTHKYDTLPPLATVAASRAPAPAVPLATPPCRAFPQCRYGARCAFSHPRCKFGPACSRRDCVYEHAAPIVASHVVPAANYKSISTSGPSNMCKFYPHCSNAACHFYHPAPCRYGPVCANKLECNFYHPETSAALKWRSAV